MEKIHPSAPIAQTASANPPPRLMAPTEDSGVEELPPHSQHVQKSLLSDGRNCKLSSRRLPVNEVRDPTRSWRLRCVLGPRDRILASSEGMHTQLVAMEMLMMMRRRRRSLVGLVRLLLDPGSRAHKRVTAGNDENNRSQDGSRLLRFTVSGRYPQHFITLPPLGDPHQKIRKNPDDSFSTETEEKGQKKKQSFPRREIEEGFKKGFPQHIRSFSQHTGGEIEAGGVGRKIEDHMGTWRESRRRGMYRGRGGRGGRGGRADERSRGGGGEATSMRKGGREATFVRMGRGGAVGWKYSRLECYGRSGRNAGGRRICVHGCMIGRGIWRDGRRRMGGRGGFWRGVTEVDAM
eukprot:746936-Hanusia_phi.AAC.3